MPYRDPERARAAARERSRRFRKRHRPEGWTDGRGRHGNHARGARNARWRHGLNITSHGYVRIQVGKTHPMADPNGYAYLHDLVEVSASLVALVPGDVVHHEDGDRQNNRLENLRRMKVGEHTSYHRRRAKPSLPIEARP